MLSEDKIIALYCTRDDMLKEMHHHEDEKVRVSDAEVITTAFVSVLYFGGHLEHGCHFMKMKGYAPKMLSKSRFCRRLHRLADFVLTLFFYLGKKLNDMAGAATYRLDSFPVAVCVITSAFPAAASSRMKSFGVNMPPCEGISMAYGCRS